MNNRKFQFLLFFMFATFLANAQSIEAGAWLGGINSFDDINTNSNFSTIRPGGGIVGKYNFNNRISAEFMAGVGTAFSKDASYKNDTYQINRNEGVKIKTTDIQFAGEFNFLPFGGVRDSDITPYLTTGIGLTKARPMVYSRQSNSYVSASTLNAEAAEEFKGLMLNIPVGGGVKYKLNEQFHLAGEFSSRILFSDYYDGFSTQYTQSGIDNSPGSLSNVGIQRGDRSRNDSYSLITAQITYVIPFNKCW